MKELSIQIQKLLPKEKQFLHQIYIKTIGDYAYLWEEFPDIEKLRKILLFIIKLFYIEHKGLKDLSQLEQEKFKKTFRELLTNHDALLQKTKRSQIKEIEGIGIEEWLIEVKRDIMTINEIVEKYQKYGLNDESWKKLTDITYKNLSWRVPRTTLDFLIAYLQRDKPNARGITYIGLLNNQEKQEYIENRQQLKEALLAENPNPSERLSQVLTKWSRWSQNELSDLKGEVRGSVYWSKAYRDSKESRDIYKDGKNAHIMKMRW